MIFLVLACAAEATAPDAALTLDNATLVLADRGELHAETAKVQADGNGTARGVDARVEPSSGAPSLDVRAERSRWDLKAHTVLFEGEVVATRGELTLQCESLDVRFSTPERVEQATAVGSVVVTRGERRATSDRAELAVDSGELVLTGTPVLSEGSNRMTGERITIWLDQEQVDCERCRVVVDGPAVAPGAQ